MHHSYMIALSALFIVVFVIIIYSMIKHRKASGASAGSFFGPTGGVQWFWALVPLVILGFVNFALIDVADDQASAIPKKIELATMQTPPGTTR